MSKKKILILCTGNSCRSQIAEGFLKNMLGDRVEVYSAGIETHGVNPRAIITMDEVAIDISNHSSNNLTEYESLHFDHLITVCDHANESCPVFNNATKHLHYNFPDPAKATGTEDEILASFRATREEINTYLKDFVETHYAD